MKGINFIGGFVLAGVMLFTSCGTMQQRERGEHREFRCGTTTALVSEKPFEFSDSFKSDATETMSKIETQDSKMGNREAEIGNNEAQVATTLVPNITFDINNPFITNAPPRICTKLPQNQYQYPLVEINSEGSKPFFIPNKIASFLPNRSERVMIKEHVVSKIKPDLTTKKNRGIDAGDFLPVEGIISILSGLLGLYILPLIFGVIAVLFAWWGWNKRFSILSKIGFWIGVIDIIWGLLMLLKALI